MNPIAILFNLVFFIAAVWVFWKFKGQVMPFGMGVSLKHGNDLSLVILDTGRVFPTLAAWNGTTGNCIRFRCLSDEGSENNATVNPVIYRTNDKAIYTRDVSEETGETKAKLFLHDELTNSFLFNAVKAAIAAGKFILEYYNMGYHEAKWQESFKVGQPLAQRKAVAGNPAPNEYEFLSMPDSTGFTVSAANITAWEVVYAGMIHCAGPHVIAANETEIIVYTSDRKSVV